MNYRGGKFLTVVFAVLVILAAGPTVAFASAQAYPPVEPLESDDIRKTHSEVTPTLPPTSSAHFATTPFRPEAALDDRTDDPVWPNSYGFLMPGERKGQDQDEGENGKQATDEGNDGAAGQNETTGNSGVGKGTGEGEGKQKDTKGARRHDGNGRDAGRDEGRDHHGGNSKSGCKDTASGTGPPNESDRGPGQCGRNGSLTVESGDIQLGPNATALEHRQAAIALLESANATGPGNSGRAFDRKRQRALAHLYRTFTHHLDASRVTSAAVFKLDKRAIIPVNKQVPNATRHLVVADRRLAGQAIADAVTVKSELDGRNISYDAAAVRENVSMARAAYQQGRQLPDQARHARIDHYRKAWSHAQRAIDVMDEAVTPTVTVESRSDLPHNESRTLNVTGTVFDVRPYELHATVAVNGTNYDLPLSNDTAPAVNVTFNTPVTLQRQWPHFENGTLAENGVVRTYTVNATVYDPGTDLADQGYDEVETYDLHHPQEAGATMYFDADGLPGWYEENTTRTDPLDPDSDVSATNQSEAGDGVVDGLEDPDNDRIVSIFEFRIGTNPVAPDSDRDGLTDGWEFDNGYDPLDRDSEDDGVTDGTEDPDNDTVGNVDEQRFRTNPVRNDTDEDGLSDGKEAYELGTNGTKADTDDDHLPDSDEIDLGTDPLDPDTDDDSTLDGNETFTTKTSDEATGVTVTATGVGNVAEELEINATAPAANVSDRSSSIVRITSTTEFDSATVAMRIDSANVSDLSGLKIYRWHPGQNETWQPVTTAVVDGVAVANVSSVGYFTVRDPDAWKEATSATMEVNLTVGVGSQLTISNDRSLSIEEKVQLLKEAKTDVSIQRRIGPPGGGGGDDCPTPTPPPGCIIGCGPGDDGGSETKNVTVSVPDAPTVTLHVKTTSPEGPDQETTQISVGDSESFSVTKGGSTSHDISTLRGKQVDIEYVPEDIAVIYLTKDSDGDSFPDSVERTTRADSIRLPIGAGEKMEFSLHPDKADSDGDGIPDNTEIELHWQLDGTELEVTVVSATSNPARADTDGDRLTDSIEFELGTNVAAPDTDGDNRIDPSDPVPQTALPEIPSGLEKYGWSVFCASVTTVSRWARFACAVGLENSKTMMAGAILGEAGFKDGPLQSKYRGSPYYLTAWIVTALTPGAEVPADLRDGITNFVNGDPAYLLDFISLLPVFADDAPKVAKIISKWVRKFPSKAAAAVRILATVVFENIGGKAGAAIRKAAYKAFGMGDDYKRLITDGGAKWSKINNKLKIANKYHSGKLRDGTKLTISDVVKKGEDPAGNLFSLIDTGKWASNAKATQTSGFRHIIARHVHPNSKYYNQFVRKSGYPVKPSALADDTATLFPRSITSNELQSLIMTATRKGHEIAIDKYTSKIVYSVPDSYKYDIEVISVIVRKKSGLIKTAYPEAGSDVTKYPP